ncbi:renal dipeptidase family [Aspergillus tetrazonus]
MDSALLARAMSILKRTPLIDGHNDFPYILRGWYGLSIDDPSFNIDDMPIGQTDLSRLETGRIGGQFWSAFVPGPKQDTTEAKLQALRDTIQQIDLIHNLIRKTPRRLAFASDSASVWQAFRSGRIACLIGIEGLHQIGGSFSALRMFHRMGARYVTMSHDCHNEFVDSSTPPAPLHNGLSKRGQGIVYEMNRTGMIIDLSHTSHEAQRQVLRVTKAPVMFSHSSCYALQPHPRNVPDDVLEALKANNGVIMICFLPSLSGVLQDGNNTPANVKTVAAHVMYVGEKIGYEHVGIGSDFDGMLEGPEGLDDVSAYPSLVAELLARGVREEDVKRILGTNLLRVLDAVALYASQNAARQALCDEVHDIWTDAQRDMLTRKGTERRGHK